MKTTDIVDNQYKRDDLPKIGSGDEVKVHVRVVEGGKERIQIFQGNIVSITGSGIAESYTVRSCRTEWALSAHSHCTAHRLQSLKS